MARAKKKSRRVGQGSIYQRKDGRWEGAVTYGYNDKGNPKRHRVIKKTCEEATKALNEIISRLNLGVPVTEEKQSTGEFLDFWLKEHANSKAPKTYRYYEQMVRLYLKPSIGHIALNKLTPQHVQAVINKYKEQGRVKNTSEGLSARTIHGIRATLRAALNTAWRWNLIRENPALKITVPKVERKEPVYLTLEEVQKLLNQAKDHYLYHLFEIALLSGLRVGEATGLRWEDVNFESGTVHIRNQLQRQEKKLQLRDLKSTSSRRVLALPSSAIESLQAQKAKQLLWSMDKEDKPFNEMGLCFTGTEGLPLDPKNIDKHLKSFASKAKIKKTISFHKLRHTVATHMAASGIPLNLVKDQLGHSQIGLTINTYSHAVPTALREAANKLGELMSVPNERGAKEEA